MGRRRAGSSSPNLRTQGTLQGATFRSLMQAVHNSHANGLLAHLRPLQHHAPNGVLEGGVVLVAEGGLRQKLPGGWQQEFGRGSWQGGGSGDMCSGFSSEHVARATPTAGSLQPGQQQQESP